MKTRQAKKQYNELYLKYSIKCSQNRLLRQQVALLEGKLQWQTTVSELCEKRREELMQDYLELAEQKRKLEEGSWIKRLFR